MIEGPRGMRNYPDVVQRTYQYPNPQKVTTSPLLVVEISVHEVVVCAETTKLICNVVSLAPQAQPCPDAGSVRVTVQVPLTPALKLPAAINAAVLAPPTRVELEQPDAENVALDGINAGNLAADNVPELIFDALVVSVVAEVANATPLVFVQVRTPVPLVEQSPDRFPLLMVDAPEKNVRFPLVGVPVMVAPPPEEHGPLIHLLLLD